MGGVINSRKQYEYVVCIKKYYSAYCISTVDNFPKVANINIIKAAG